MLSKIVLDKINNEINSFKLFKKNWIDGNSGNEYNVKNLNLIQDLINENWNDLCISFHVYPSIDSNVSFETETTQYSIIIETDFKNNTLEFNSYNKFNNNNEINKYEICKRSLITIKNILHEQLIKNENKKHVCK
jgi:hypothetical protein